MRLPTWQHVADADPLTPRAVEQRVLGVSFGGAGGSGAPLSGAAAMSDVRNGAALAVSPSQHSA